MLKYRPEIDGLRAFAVMAVIIYHAKFSFFNTSFLKGGYIGVDIFLVISGYLITFIILKSLARGHFTLLHFYEKRLRRLIPLLLSVLLTSLPFAWLYMTPKAMKDYALSLLSSIFFSSNFLFWAEDSYWAEPGLLKPFLHTWTLSLEEQFYLSLFSYFYLEI